MTGEPKRHHYVPESYSKAFTGSDGILWIFDKWDNEVRAQTPKNALVVGRLYRQPVHAERRFDNAIENYFAKTSDADLPLLRAAIENRQTLDQLQWGKLVEYICGQLVRVPLSMNSVIELLREQVLAVSNSVGPLPAALVDANQKITGKIASEFRELTDSGVVKLEIDPHRSISSMPRLVQSIPLFQPSFSFGVPKFLHNETALEFVSSDNPIVFHSGRHGDTKIKPYNVISDRTFAFYFPISPRIMMVNSTFNSKKSMHCTLSDINQVSLLNRSISRFSYRYIVSRTKKLAEDYGKRYRDICPRPKIDRSILSDGHVEKIGYEFGKPVKIPNRWDYEFAS